jgi:hypothetical protein
MNDFNEGCCPGAVEPKRVVVTRHILFDSMVKKNHGLVRSKKELTQDVIEYKALSRRNGNVRRKDVNQSGIETKANAVRKLGSTLTSLAVPGDSDPFRSPVRSAVYRTLTPGKPGGIGGSIPGQNRGYRCPEGYQYGGRFTDSRLSTCGVQLFDIPSPLGLALRAIRKVNRKPKVEMVEGNPILGVPTEGSLIQSRKPTIPKVSQDNRASAARNAADMVRDISSSSSRAVRMVRRDGFVLQPVVPAKVLRAIPDNRDMEGATYIMSVFSPSEIGNDELGLLSNTGVRKIVYILPGGSTLSLEKKRVLEVGERRKLGRTVNTSMTLNNSSDPAARLKAVANETGDGIGYEEYFANVKNPNAIVNGKQRWASEVFGKGKIKKPIGEAGTISRESNSNEKISGKIDTLDEALAHIESGGTLSDISPKLLAVVLASTSILKVQKLNNEQSLVVNGSDKYFLYNPPVKFQHLAERFAADVQQHLGLESPDVLFVGGPSDRRSYLRQDVETALKGSKFNPNIKFDDLKPEDVAKIMISDFLTDQRTRPGSSIYPLETASGTVPMLAQNTTSGLIALADIEITKRTKMNIEEYYVSLGIPRYSEYYNTLRGEQQVMMRKSIDSYIRRAMSFSVADLRNRLNPNGLTIGEKNHLSIIGKLYENRLESLTTRKRTIAEILKGK